VSKKPEKVDMAYLIRRAPHAEAQLRALLGCDFGVLVGLKQNEEVCMEQAVGYMVVHESLVARRLKLCQYHRELLMHLTTDARLWGR
jgi:hypothetical protein